MCCQRILSVKKKFIIEINPNGSVITKKMNELDFQIKRHRWPNWLTKKIYLFFFFAEGIPY